MKIKTISGMGDKKGKQIISVNQLTMNYSIIKGFL